MSDYLTTPPVHPCLECSADPCVCDVSIGDHTTTVDMWKAKLAAAEARIAELEPELKVLRECEQHWLERDKALEARIAELERERDEALMLTESCSSLKEMAAACVEAAARIAELEAEQEENHKLRESMATKLTRIANLVKGPPPPLTLHSWHDLPEVVERALLDKK